MAKWVPQKSDVLDALVAEILHNYSRSRAAIAIDGIPGSGTEQFARDLTAAFERHGHQAEVDIIAGSAMVGDADAERIRAGVIAAFRSAATTPGVLLVAGFGLLRPELVGSWNFTIWLDVSRELADSRAGIAGDSAARDRYWAEVAPRAAASAIVDTTDLEHPRRVFADSC